MAGTSFAQKKKEAKSIISENVAIKKYHDKEELDGMQIFEGESTELFDRMLKIQDKRSDWLMVTGHWLLSGRLSGEAG